MSGKVLGNIYLRQAIFQFATQDDQDRCKRVSRAFRQYSEGFQRAQILKQFSPEVIECIGRVRLDAAPIFNVHTEVELIRVEDLPRHASFFIGSAGEQSSRTLYMLAKIDYLVKGSCCLGCCCTLAVDRGVNVLQASRPMVGMPDVCWTNVGGTVVFCSKAVVTSSYELPFAKDLARLLNGEKLSLPDLPARGPLAREPEQSCCFSRSLFSCFRNCFFETRPRPRDPLPCQMKLA
jgi:hypothetical protein